MKWTYEELCVAIDEIGFDYIEDKISHEKMDAKQDAVLSVAGWTWDEMMDECERRIK